jgi:hypothetical protein
MLRCILKNPMIVIIPYFRKQTVKIKNQKSDSQFEEEKEAEAQAKTAKIQR